MIHTKAISTAQTRIAAGDMCDISAYFKEKNDRGFEPAKRQTKVTP